MYLPILDMVAPTVWLCQCKCQLKSRAGLKVLGRFRVFVITIYSYMHIECNMGLCSISIWLNQNRTKHSRWKDRKYGSIFKMHALNYKS